MQRFFGTNRTVLALWLNAAFLLLILLAITTRDGRLLAGSTALGQSMQAPGNLTIMPGQLSNTTWGCYVMDLQNQTLSVYQFMPSDHNLKLAAARDIQFDRKLGFFNTTPPPLDVKAMLDRAAEPNRAAATTNKSPESSVDR